MRNSLKFFLMENNMGKISKLMGTRYPTPLTVCSLLATHVFRCMQKNTILDAVRVSGRMGI